MGCFIRIVKVNKKLITRQEMSTKFLGLFCNYVSPPEERILRCVTVNIQFSQIPMGLFFPLLALLLYSIITNATSND